MGFTSLKYLYENRFDNVKLDGSLVRGISANKSSSEIIESIIYLSHSMSFDVIAEFVESEDVQKQLEKLGCLMYQDYLYEKPGDITQLLKDNK